jgi:hypothetical protein
MENCGGYLNVLQVAEITVVAPGTDNMIEPAGPVAVWNHGTVDDDCRK